MGLSRPARWELPGRYHDDTAEMRRAKVMPPAVTTGISCYPDSMQIINQYSLIIFGLVGLIAAALLLMRNGKGRGRVAVLAVVTLALLGGWAAVRPTATPAAAVSEVRAQIGQGLPVLIELQSPY